MSVDPGPFQPKVLAPFQVAEFDEDGGGAVGIGERAEKKPFEGGSLEALQDGEAGDVLGDQRSAGLEAEPACQIGRCALDMDGRVAVGKAGEERSLRRGQRFRRAASVPEIDDPSRMRDIASRIAAKTAWASNTGSAKPPSKAFGFGVATAGAMVSPPRAPW